MATRKTRGPRTEHEKIVDVARRAASMFEDLPPSRQKDDYLAPIATLLRFYFGSASRRRAAEAEQAYLGLVERLRKSWGWYFAADGAGVTRRPGTTNDEIVRELKELTAELAARLENYVSVADSSSEATDEGLALSTKAQALLWDAGSSAMSARRALERAAIRDA